MNGKGRSGIKDEAGTNEHFYMYINVMSLTRYSTTRDLHEELDSVHAQDGVAHMA